MRWLVSKLMTRLFTEKRMRAKRAKAETRRKKSGTPHSIEYFHQLDDGYSHLATQRLKSLAQRYDVEFICHLVNSPENSGGAGRVRLEYSQTPDRQAWLGNSVGRKSAGHVRGGSMGRAELSFT